MRTVFTLIFSLSFFPHYSQPTLTSANDPSTGNNFIFEIADTTGISPGSGGILQTWDFSSATPVGIQKAENWTDPSSTPFQSLYPTATIVQLNDDGLGGFIYTYITQSTTQIELNGIVTTINPTAVDMHYSNSQILRQYPATFNNTLQDDYEGMSFVTLGPITANTYRTGSYEYLVDGYGTLITPAGTYPNTLRIKLHQAYTDSTVYSGIPLPTVIVHGSSTTYFWASTDPGDKLYQFYIGYDTTVTQAGTTNFTNVSYQNYTTGLQEFNPTKSAFAYPNPATEWTKIRINDPFAGKTLLRIFNTEGKLVRSLEANIMNQNYLEWWLSLTEFSTGIYTVIISSDDSYWTTRIIKQ